jgi:hypothetical protein
MRKGCNQIVKGSGLCKKKTISSAEHLQNCEVENRGQPVPKEPGGVEPEEAAAGPRERESGFRKY